MKDCGGEDEDGCVDEEGEHEGGCGVDVGEADGFALALLGARVVARLDDGGVEIEVVRHDGGAEDADGDVEHLGVGKDGLRGDDEVTGDGEPLGMREQNFDAEESGDGADEGDDQSFKVAESAVLEEQDEEHVGTGDDDADEKGNVEEKLEGDGRADDLGEVAGADGDLSEEPEEDVDRAAVGFAAGLGEVSFGGDSEFEGEALEEDRHEVGEHDDEEEGVAVL